MQHIYTSIITFVIREWRTFVAIGIFAAIVYVWDKLSEKEWYYRWLIKINPKNAEAHYWLGNFLENIPDQRAEAETAYQQAIALRPQYTSAYYALYYLQIKEKNLTGAQEILETMLRIFPKDGITHTYQAINLWHRQGLYPEAEGAFKSAIRLTPNFSRIHSEYGRYLMQLGRQAEAETEFRAAIRIEPSNADLYGDLGNLLKETNRYLEAEAIFKKAIKLAPKNEQSYVDLWTLLEIQERFAEVVEYAEKLLKLDPNNLRALQNLGYAFAKMNKTSEAEQVLRQVINKAPNDPWAYHELGVVLQSIDNRQLEAEQAYGKAIELDPLDSKIHFNLALLLIESNRQNEAEVVYHKAFELEPTEADNYLYLSGVLRNKNHEHEALNVLQKAIEIAPNDYYLNIGIASLQKLIGNMDEAKKYAEKSCLLIKEDSENYWYDLACLNCIVENYDSAFQQLQKASKENKINREWAWEDPDLQWIRDDPRFVEIVGPKPEK